MGVVYSGAELWGCKLPAEGAHMEAAACVVEEVGGMEEAVLTVVHGSVVNGTSNVRSDLDVLVTYDSSVLMEEPKIVRSINRALGRIGRETNVKIEANIWPADEALEARKERMYDLLFSWHLARSMKHPDWAVGDPDEKILEIADHSLDDEGALRRVILNYTTYKHSGFAKAPTYFDESDKALAALQRAFELPKALGRKIRQMEGDDAEASADENLEALESSGLKGKTRYALERLSELDAAYTGNLEELWEFYQGGPDECTFKSYKDELTRVYPVAIDLGIVAASGFTNYITAS